MDCTYEDIAKMIDHSILRPTHTDDDLEAGCRLAVEYNVASVCLKPYYLKRCAEILAGTTVLPSTVIGFPHGSHLPSVKAKETEVALADGAEEVDMVVNIGKVLCGDWAFVRDDIAAVVEVTRAAGKVVKVIFENCYLADDQKVRLCAISSELGADFVKTSTGFGSGGATLEDCRLMREHCPPEVQVKASGGVKTLDEMIAYRAIGVTRCGCSATAAVLDALRARLAK